MYIFLTLFIFGVNFSFLMNYVMSNKFEAQIVFYMIEFIDNFRFNVFKFTKVSYYTFISACRDRLPG